MGRIFSKLRCRLGFHLWTYGGYEITWTDGSYSITGYRVCMLCVPYIRQRWQHGWEGKGKSRWVKMNSKQFEDAVLSSKTRRKLNDNN